MTFKKFSKDIWLLHFSTFFFFLGIALVFPLISPLAILLGATPLIVGSIASISSIVALFLKPFGGFLGDKGWKFQVMMLGSILGAVAGVFYVLSVSLGNLTLFAVGRGIHGFGMALFFPSSLATAIELAPKGRVGETLGWRGMMFSLSNLIGPAVGGFVADYFGFQSAFIFTILLSLIAAGFVSTAYRTNQKKNKQKKTETSENVSYRLLLNPFFIAASLSLLLLSLAYSGMFTFLPALYKVIGLGTSAFGIYASIMGGFSLLTRVFGGREADRRGPIPVATFGFLLLLLAYALLALNPTPPKAYLSAIPLGMGFGFAIPSLQMMALAKLPQKIRTFGSSIYTMFFDLGYLSGPLIFGYIAQLKDSYWVVFPILPAVILIAVIILQLPRFFKGKKPKQKRCS
ncbi:MFS transporter [Thermococcus paralvinellae]|uniref:Major facilitator superfamily permease n=1 Tax=Thermococcus paralvinellae TaxID=582419 RepID=W0I7I4_9EURY|nr:MFS transporter [Thermococcus paralvinellae]AHF80415.1 major facilitator superfamily permease [Thermococcus paralvinellae]